jgi:hypothetical protein
MRLKNKLLPDLSEETLLGQKFNPFNSLGLIGDPQFHNKLLAHLLTVPGDHGYGNVFLKKLLKHLRLGHLNFSKVWVETDVTIPPTNIEAAAGERPLESRNILIELEGCAVIMVNGFMDDEIREAELYRTLRFAFKKYGRYHTTMVYLSMLGNPPLWTSFYSTAVRKSTQEFPMEIYPIRRSYPQQFKNLSMKYVISLIQEMIELFPQLPISSFLDEYCTSTAQLIKTSLEKIRQEHEEDPFETKILLEFTTQFAHAITASFGQSFFTKECINVFEWKNKVDSDNTEWAEASKMAGTHVVGSNFRFFAGVLEYQYIIFVWREEEYSQTARALGYKANKNYTYKTYPLKKVLRDFTIPLQKNWLKAMAGVIQSFIDTEVLPSFRNFRNYKGIESESVITLKEYDKINNAPDECLDSFYDCEELFAQKNKPYLLSRYRYSIKPKIVVLGYPENLKTSSKPYLQIDLNQAKQDDKKIRKLISLLPENIDDFYHLIYIPIIQSVVSSPADMKTVIGSREFIEAQLRITEKALVSAQAELIIFTENEYTDMLSPLVLKSPKSFLNFRLEPQEKGDFYKLISNPVYNYHEFIKNYQADFYFFDGGGNIRTLTHKLEVGKPDINT